MQKYKVTVLKDNMESVITVRAVGDFQAIKQIQTGYKVDKVIRVETKDEFKKRTSKYMPTMKSSFCNVKSTKRNAKDK